MDLKKLIFPDQTLNFIKDNNWQFVEKDLIDFCKKHYTNTNKVFVDIGAHVGSYCLSLAENFEKCYAFEPSKDVYNYLIANIGITKLNNKITAYEVALDSDKRHSDYYVRESGNGTSGLKLVEKGALIVGDDLGYYSVQTNTLDSYNIRNVGLIKIDVEGYEMSVLKGAVDTIVKNNYPTILFECNYFCSFYPEFEAQGLNLQESQKKVFDFLSELGYKIHKFKDTDMYVATYDNSMKGLLQKYIVDYDDLYNRFWLGYEYEKIGHCSSGMGYYLSCAENTNDDLLAYESLIRMGIGYRKIGERISHYKNCIQMAITLLPDRPEGYFLMSDIYNITIDYRDEDKWYQCYMWATIGERIFQKFKGEPLMTKIDHFYGQCSFDLLKSLSSWWMGRFQDSANGFSKLKNYKELPEEYKDIVDANIKKILQNKVKWNT